MAHAATEVARRRLTRVPQQLCAARDETDRQFAAFCLDMIDRAERATERGPRHPLHAPGGVSVALFTNGESYSERLTRAIRHTSLETGDVAEPQLRVFAVDAAVGDAAEPPVWGFPLGHARHLERLHVTQDRAIYVTYQEELRSWHVFDRNSGRAAIWTADASQLPDWEHSFPLRTQLGWFVEPHPATLAHAAVIGDGRRGVLLVGAGGSGKSTTTVACVALGLGTCGDDFVLIETGPQPRGRTLFDTVKLDAASLARFPQFEPFVANPERDREEKARIHLSDVMPECLLDACVLHHVVVPRLAPGEKTSLHTLPRAAALRALAPTTVFLARGTEARTIAKLADVVRGLPTHELRIGGSPAEAAQVIASLVEAGPG